MRFRALGAALALIPFVLSTSACRVCKGACAAKQGQVVTGIVPAADGSVTVTRCELTTSGQGGAASGCQQYVLPAPGATSTGGAP